MKKIIPLLAGFMALSAVGLSSCGKEFEIAKDKTMFSELMSGMYSFAATGSTSIDVGPNGGAALSGDVTPEKGSMLLLTTKQVLSDGSTAEISYDLEGIKSKIDNEFQYDDTHRMYEFKFPECGQPDENVKIGIKSVKIGKYGLYREDLETLYKANIGDESENLDINLVLSAHTLKYDELSIGYLTELNAAGDGYKSINYEKDSPYFYDNYEQGYHYGTIKGKIIYVCPDFNGGVIGDGTKYTEFYFGGTDGERAKNFPAIKEGNYVELTGNIGQYNGNHQFTFITKARELKDHSMVAEPNGFQALTDTEIASWVQSNGKHNVVVPGIMNKLVTITGTFAGNLSGGTSFVSGKHPSFDMQVGSQKLKVYYDYHVIGALQADIADKLTALVTGGASATHTIKGTLRYQGSGVGPKLNAGDGYWTVAPLIVD